MMRLGLAAIALLSSVGCSALVEPGHRGMLFDPSVGLSRTILAPGSHPVGLHGHIEDFDVTYTSRTETLQAITVEGLSLSVGVSIIFRPIVSELYELDTEVGHSYYEDVIGPELRSVARATFAKRSCIALLKSPETIEDEIERDVRRRVAGKHIEISAVTVGSLALPPELVAAIRAREVAEEIARRRKIEAESEAAAAKLKVDAAWDREKVELEHKAERRRLEREAESPR